MKKEVHYLDEKYNKTTPDKATFMVIRYLDEKGRMVREAFGVPPKEGKPAA